MRVWMVRGLYESLILLSPTPLPVRAQKAGMPDCAQLHLPSRLVKDITPSFRLRNWNMPCTPWWMCPEFRGMCMWLRCVPSLGKDADWVKEAFSPVAPPPRSHMDQWIPGGCRAVAIAYPLFPGSLPFLLRRLLGLLGMTWIKCYLVPFGVSRNCCRGGFCISLSLYFQGSPGPAGPRGNIGRPGFWGKKVTLFLFVFKYWESYIFSWAVWKFLNDSTQASHSSREFLTVYLPLGSCSHYKESYLPITKHCWESPQLLHSLSRNAFVGWDEWMDLNSFLCLFWSHPGLPWLR